MENNEPVSPITATSLYQLNDDCLLEIFSSNCLSTLDLCSLAETCTRFKRLTQGAFPREFKVIVGSECGYNNTREYKFQSKNYSSSSSVNDVVRILTNFGSHLSALTMHGNDSTVTDVVSKYCDDGSLKRMEIFDMGIIEDVSVKFKKIFYHLEALSFNGAHKDHEGLRGTNIPLNCDSLLELEIMCVNGCSAILSNTFPNLERFCFQQYHIGETDIVLEFIGRHKSLRALEWHTGFSIIFRNNFARAINNCCKELQKLTLKSFQRNNIINLSELRGLTKLTMLDVEILHENHQLSELLPALKSLEILKMSNMMVEADVMDSLTELKHMRELNLVGCTCRYNLWPVLPLTKLRLIDHTFFKSEFFELIPQLPNLEELEIYSWETDFVMSERLYAKIGEIVNQRPNELKLKCRFAPRRDFCNVYYKKAN